ncbi:MAG TPA: hypothetical protein VF476_15900 [Chitinophagaceae bacterium]
MTQRLISRIAIWLLCIIMIVFGIYHFRHPHNLLEYVPGNLPGGINSVYVVGAAYILAAIAFLTNKFVKIVGYLLAALLILSVLMIHWPIYREAGAEETKQMAFIAMLKDLAIAAFALHIAGSADSHGVKY